MSYMYQILLISAAAEKLPKKNNCGISNVSLFEHIIFKNTWKFQFLIGRVKSPRWFPLVQITVTVDRHVVFSVMGMLPLIHNNTSDPFEGIARLIYHRRNPDFSSARFLKPLVQSRDSLFPALYRAWQPRTKSILLSVGFSLVHSNSWFLEAVIIPLEVWGNPKIHFLIFVLSTVDNITATSKNVRPFEYTGNLSMINGSQSKEFLYDSVKSSKTRPTSSVFFFAVSVTIIFFVLEWIRCVERNLKPRT